MRKYRTDGVSGSFTLIDPFGYNIPGTLQSIGSIHYIAGNKPINNILNVNRLLFHDYFGKRFQPFFSRYFGTRAPFGFIGQIYIFQFIGIPAFLYPLPKFGGKFFLLLDRF